ncbi:MAG: cyclodeaminase/cyclohydrolase family protein [Defluviitaleaceae bacterium]|nr:cyclodeaminase/cyclohydrolase family protein [Defluviitaleaceae bacterium]
MKQLFDISVKDLVQEIASERPAPGVGSVAAMCGALGSALVVMVANISRNEKTLSRYDESLKEALIEIIQIKNELATNMQREAESFEAIVTANSMPSHPEAARIEKKEATQRALKIATIIPFEIMTLCSKGLKIIQKSLGKTTLQTIGEFGGAAIILNSAIKSASLVVLINLRLIEDQSFVKDFQEKSQELLGTGENMYREVHSHCVREILGNKT